MEKIRVKVCGNMRTEDIRAADMAGADYVGVVTEASVSKRSVTAEEAAELLSTAANAMRVMLVFNPEPERLKESVGMVKPDIVHLTGEESAADVQNLKSHFDGEVFKSVHLPPAESEAPPIERTAELITSYKEAGADKVVLDTRDVAGGLWGGTGKVSDWSVAAEIVKASTLPVFLAGGLSLDNVDRAMAEVMPFGVDLASGLESETGRKNHKLIEEFVRKVHSFYLT